MRPLSLDHLTVIDATPLELIDAAAAGGFERVGLRIVAPSASRPVVDMIGQPQLQREFKARLASTGISVGLVEVVWLTPHTIVADLEPMLATGAELGARFVMVAGDDTDDVRQTANLGELSRLAQPYGLDIVFEFIPFTQVRSFAQARRIVRQVAAPNLRMLVDALHTSRSGEDLRHLETQDCSLVSYVHLCDAPAELPPPEALRDEARLGRLDLGDGELPLDAFLDAMPANAALGVEVPSRLERSLSPVERGKIAGRKARTWLQRYEERRQ